ncbi:NWD2 protein [Moniliophthora roreri MCA 2997]|uniref:NWD2 protein n=1 Tax=Moniliophthora roreri (strain MCA 2997) TaxID=1381753 RepID=V2YF12_MONRO|nr:NWD2 protein [Moniliophthora roreri MCA 2997]
MDFAGSEHNQRNAHNMVYRDQINTVYRSATPSFNDSIAEKTLQSLAEKAAAHASYDSAQRFPPPNCHPDTRTEMLGTLSEWIDSHTPPIRVYWLYGFAGVGKSAIAQNLAEKYAGKRLAAAFFFSRNDLTRDSLVPFVASIAFQICKSNTSLKDVLGSKIIEALRADPHIFHTPFENQFRKLISEPCLELDPEEWEKLPNLIVIDGLDECINAQSQERLLAIIREVVTAFRPIPLIFLVCSRPEPQIRGAFDHEDFVAILGYLVLESSDMGHRDIILKRYLLDHFRILQKKHRALRHEGALWPGGDAVNRLVKLADGQFTFVVTVIKYIDTGDDQPQDRLNTILRIRGEGESDSPYSALDLLYHQILSTCSEWEKVYSILRLLVTPHETAGLHLERISWRTPAMITLLLNFREGEVTTLLSRLHSVLQIPDDDDSTIRIAHASFTEFLRDPHRSGGHHTPMMTKSEYCDCVATLLLRTLSGLTPHYPPYHPQSFATALSLWESRLWRADDLVGFSCYWYQYCTKVESPSPELITELGRLDPYSVLAMMVYYNSFVRSCCWRDVIAWSKSIAKSTGRSIEALESFPLQFKIAFPPGTLRRVAFWFTFKLETFLGGSGSLNQFQTDFLQALYSVEEPPLPLPFGESRDVLILPADSNTPDRPNVLLEGWLIARVTKTNGEVFDRICSALNHRENGLGLLLDDILKDACETVTQNLIEADDLIHLKSFMNERLGVFAISTSDDSYSDASYYSIPDAPAT